MVPSGTYTLTQAGLEFDVLPSNPAVGDLDILEDTVVRGAGARSTRVLAGPSLGSRVIDVPAILTTTDPPEVLPSDADVEISGLTVSDGRDSTGAGLRNVGTLHLRDVTVRENQASGDGGGVRNDLNLTIERSTVRGNSADIFGGGVFNNGTADVENSTVSGNSSDVSGGGLGNFGGSLDTLHATVAHNRAPTGANLANSDLAPDAQGPSAQAIGPLTVEDTLVANPQDGDNCAGPITSEDRNLEFPGASCGLELRADPRLGPLADNGGPTDTHALRIGSAAINAVPAGGCPPPATDQRGVARPQGPRCDLGAFELGADLRLEKSASPSRPRVGDELTFTLTVTNRGPDRAEDVEIIDTLPPGVTFLRASAGCTASGRTVGCAVGDLTAGASATRRIVVRVDRPGPIENRAVARSATPDPSPNTARAGATGTCTINGTPGNDIIRATPGPDIICAGAGNDIVYGLGANDTVFGGPGNDVLRGGPGADRLEGEGGDDQLVGGDGNDRLVGARGATTSPARRATTGSRRATASPTTTSPTAGRAPTRARPTGATRGRAAETGRNPGSRTSGAPVGWAVGVDR